MWRHKRTPPGPQRRRKIMNRQRIETFYAIDDDIMPFGRYRGRELRDVPLPYWRKMLLYRWLAEHHPALHEYAKRRCPNSRAVSAHEDFDD